eukprot:10288377-Ditylum_brightwellii.AAC.1
MQRMWHKCGKRFNLLTKEGRKEDNLTLIQGPASWMEILMDTPPNHDLEDPKSTTELKMIDLPQEIVHYLKLQNQRYFGQVQ